MAASSKSVSASTRHSAAWGLLVAGGILFVLGFGGSSVLLGSERGPGADGSSFSHGAA